MRSPATRSSSVPRASNFCSMFIILDDFEDRKTPDLAAAAIQD
jgi:hypothetical protein